MNLQDHPHLARVVNTQCFGSPCQHCQHMKSFQVCHYAFSAATTKKNRTHIALYILELVCACERLRGSPKVVDAFKSLCHTVHDDALELFQVDTHTYYQTVFSKPMR